MNRLTRWGMLSAAVLLLAVVSVTRAQIVSGNIAGSVVDKTGAVLANAKVTATETATGFARTVTTNGKGEFLFNNLPTGAYTVAAEATGFAKTEIGNFPVELNKTNSVTITLDIKSTTAIVEVSGAAPPIDTTTPQIGTTFGTELNADLPVSSNSGNGGVLNLALYNAGVSTSGGLGVGTGPSVAGQRPRDNNFTIEGVDNNSKSVTGPLVYVPNDAVAEFSTLQNQFSPEFGHSNGGQFNTTIKSGTNSVHGLVYSYDQNRNFNAIDAVDSRSGFTKNPRYDNNRWGGEVGGPVVKNKLFYFANFEYNPVGQASVPGAGLCTPTAAGYSTLTALPPGPAPNGAVVSLNTNNLGILQKYAAAAPTGGNCPFTQGNANNNALFVCTGGAVPGANGSCPSGVPVPVDVGLLTFSGPNFTNYWALVTSADYNLSDKDQFRIRYIYNRADGIDNAATFPAFFESTPNRYQLVAINEYHTFKPNLTSEFRFGFNRYYSTTPAGNFSFSGLDSFPNLVFFDTGIQLGPDPNAPQFTIQNLYQFSEGLNWTHGTHNFKFGGEFRWFISPQGFTQRARGDYDYTSVGTYLYDVNPDVLAERSVGLTTYYANQKAFYWYVNDVWRIRPSLSINYGVRYEYTTIPLAEQQQSLNAIADPPTPIETPGGPLIFASPRAPKNNFEPRVGVAWSPHGSTDTVIRAGFSLAYDVLFDNLGILSLPPERIRTIDQDQTTELALGHPMGILTNYLANGAIPPSHVGATFPDQASAAAATGAFIPLNDKNPAAITWTLGVEHSFAKAYTVEVRYVGTHGYYLPVQDRINRQDSTSSTLFLPTYLQQPSQAALDALPVTLADIQAQSSFVPAYAAAGFNAANITSYQPIGNSFYHGLAAQITRRLNHGFQFIGAYTFSHGIDDSTAEVFSTYLTPRRPEDFQDVANDKSNSILDRRHRFTLALVYDMPYFKSGNWARQNLLGNWLISPIYTYESPEWLDVQSGIDSNLNGDSAGDRALLNPKGTVGTGSGVTALMNSAGDTVAYLAGNPSAQYIQAGSGALEPNNGLLVAGRNTLPSSPINNVDMNIAKTFKINERMNIQFSCQAYNLFNKPQFSPGFVDSVFPTSGTNAYTVSRDVVEPQSSIFNQDRNFFPSHARLLQLGFKFQF